MGSRRNWNLNWNSVKRLHIVTVITVLVTLVLLFLAMNATASHAQLTTGWTLPSPFVFVTAQPLVTHASASFENQFTPGSQNFSIQISAAARWPGYGTLIYTYAPGFSRDEEFLPRDRFRVAGVVWNEKSNSAGSGNSGSGTTITKPLLLTWKTGTTNRFLFMTTAPLQSLMPPFITSPLQLCGAIDLTEMNIEAQGKRSDGKAIDVTEMFRRSFWGLGAMLSWQPLGIRGVAGPDYRLLDFSLFWPVSTWGTVGAQYEYRSVGFGGGRLKARSDGIGIWGEVRF
jgi:hypothetical protein